MVEEGKAVGELDPGWYWVVPVYQDVKILSFRTETYKMSSSQSSHGIKNDPRSEDSISLKTKEGLNSQMDVSIRYRKEKERMLNWKEKIGCWKSHLLRKNLKTDRLKR